MTVRSLLNKVSGVPHWVYNLFFTTLWLQGKVHLPHGTNTNRHQQQLLCVGPRLLATNRQTNCQVCIPVQLLLWARSVDFVFREELVILSGNFDRDLFQNTCKMARWALLLLFFLITSSELYFQSSKFNMATHEGEARDWSWRVTAARHSQHHSGLHGAVRTSLRNNQVLFATNWCGMRPAINQLTWYFQCRKRNKKYWTFWKICDFGLLPHLWCQKCLQCLSRIAAVTPMRWITD